MLADLLFVALALDGQGHLIRDEVQHVEVAGRVGIGTGVVLHGQHPDDAVADAQRGSQHNFGHHAVGTDGAAADELLKIGLGKVARLPTGDDIFRHARRKRPCGLRPVLRVLVDVVGKLELRAGIVAEHDEKVTGFNNLAQLAMNGPVEAG